MSKAPTNCPPAVENFRVSVSAAEALIAEHVPVAAREACSLAAAVGKVLRQTVIAERDSPPFNRATMDGIAFGGSDSTMRKFPVAGTQAAGQSATLLPDGSCIEVMTGAVVPDGADTVVPVERIRIESGTATLEDGYPVKRGQFVHTRGSDHRQGDVLLEPGTLIGPPEMAVLATAGNADVLVSALPSVAVVSTGDELVDVGQPIGDAQIRSSNDRALAAALQQAGIATVSRHSFKDDPEQLRNGIKNLLLNNDMLVLSGGVSMGKYDYLPQVLHELGVKVVLHKITQRPGLPMWFGVSANQQLVFALPGNPVSALVCLTRYVLPAIRQSLMAPSQTEYVTLAEALEFSADLSWFVPVNVHYERDGSARAVPQLTNTSGDFCALSGTTGFIELPAELSEFPAGYVARLFRW